MKFKNLRILSYENQDVYEKEYKNRVDSLTTFNTDLFIVPYSITKKERVISERCHLFYMPLPDILLLEDKILRNSKKIQNKFSILPPLAKDKMLFNHIIKEIQSSNEIEGVRSTRKELKEAAKYKNTKKSVRFKGIVSQYLKISDSKYEKIEDVKDFRSIYDNLFLDDVKKEELPDGKLFRKETVYIQDGDKSVHQGAADEKTIINDLETLVSFMNSNSYPFLLKSAITHYYFEYVHPFYDGNGRVGRFILSSYLARKLDKFTGVSFSIAVRENRKKYLDSFIEVSNPKNKGEITHFVKTIYELIIAGQDQLINELIEYQARYKHALKFMQSKFKNEKDKEIFFIYLQNYLFDDAGQIEDREIANIQGISLPTFKKRIAPLVSNNTLIQSKKKPSVHSLSDQILVEMEEF